MASWKLVNLRVYFHSQKAEYIRYQRAEELRFFVCGWVNLRIVVDSTRFLFHFHFFSSSQMTIPDKRGDIKFRFDISDEKRLNESIYILIFVISSLPLRLKKRFLFCSSQQETRRSRKNIPSVLSVYASKKSRERRAEKGSRRDFGSKRTEIEFPFQWSTQHADRQIITPTRDEPLSIIHILCCVRLIYARHKRWSS